jgi:HNH endonuclease
MRRADIMDLFPDLVQPEPNSGCWLWTAGTNSDGYGSVSVGSKKIGAHRFSFIVSFGVINDGLFVLHKCDNPLCCNPSHLELGNQSKNLSDAYNRNRRKRPVGTLNGRAKLTDDHIAEIRAINGPLTKERRNELKHKYGITQTTIYRVKRGSWRAAS